MKPRMKTTMKPQQLQLLKDTLAQYGYDVVETDTSGIYRLRHEVYGLRSMYITAYNSGKRLSFQNEAGVRFATTPTIRKNIEKFLEEFYFVEKIYPWRGENA